MNTTKSQRSGNRTEQGHSTVRHTKDLYYYFSPCSRPDHPVSGHARAIERSCTTEPMYVVTHVIWPCLHAEGQNGPFEMGSIPSARIKTHETDVTAAVRDYIKGTYNYSLNLFRRELTSALEIENHVQEKSDAGCAITKLQAFQREFRDLYEFTRHIQKAKEFQNEIDRAAVQLDGKNGGASVREFRRLVFLKFRDENYRISLELEGLKTSSPNAGLSSLASLKEKYVR